MSTTDFNAKMAATATANAERMLALSKQWTDWQLAQMKTFEGGMKTAMHTSFSAMEQMIGAAYETQRLLVQSFAPADKPQA